MIPKTMTPPSGHLQPLGRLRGQEMRGMGCCLTFLHEHEELAEDLEKRRATAHGTTGQRDNGTPGHRANGTTGQRDTGPTGQRDTGPTGHRANGTPGQRDNGPTGRRETVKPTRRANGTMTKSRKNSKGNTHGIKKRASQATKLDDGWPESVEEHVTLL